MADELAFASARAQARALRARELMAVELIEDQLARVERQRGRGC